MPQWLFSARIFLCVCAALQAFALILVVLGFIFYITIWPLSVIFPIIASIAGAMLVFFPFCALFFLPTRANSLAHEPVPRFLCILAFAFATGVAVLLVVGALMFAFWAKIDENNDLIYARMGAVSDTTARVFVRIKEPANDLVTVWWRPAESGQEHWQSQTTLTSSQEDWTADFVLEELSPSSAYEWTMSSPQEHTPQSSILKFQTAPPPSALAPFSFAFGSCIIPTATLTFEHLRDIRDRSPDFMLFLGDFIYVDHPLYIGDAQSTYHAKYRQVLSYEDAAVLFRDVPSFFMYDDHEVFNDWREDEDDERIKNGVTAWVDYLGRTNPPAFAPARSIQYYTFQYGRGADFFVLDTHTFVNSHTFLGPTQLFELEQWLIKSVAVFKFIVSPVSFSFFDMGPYTWTEAALCRLIDILVRTNATGVVLLSADLHLGAVGRVTFCNAPPGLFEVASSPLGAFSDFGYRSAPDDTLFFENSEMELSSSIHIDPVGEPSFNVTFYKRHNDVLYSNRFVLQDGIIQTQSASLRSRIACIGLTLVCSTVGSLWVVS